MLAVEDPLFAKPETWQLNRFHEEREDFITRPPYQRKTVWENSKKKSLMESFIRKLYVPPVVLRLVSHDTHHIYEVVDGQQRITTIQQFLNNEFPLPETRDLRELSEEYEASGLYFEDLDTEVQQYINSRCTLDVSKLSGIQDAENEEHQRMATQVFWRLQQGESLNPIEESHSKIYSPVRNYVVERADNISFDMDEYRSRDHNPDRHAFFGLLRRGNNRMQHLGLLARFLLIEANDGPTKVTNMAVTQVFDCEVEGLSMNDDMAAFLDRDPVRRVDEMLDLLYELYKDSEMRDDDGKVEFLNREYFILSLYTLIRELNFGDYNFASRHYNEVREFTEEWYRRFVREDASDNAMLQFRAASQQNSGAVNERHYIIENQFWKSGTTVKQVDPTRGFSRSQRIELFLDSDRVCDLCLEKEREKHGAEASPEDARVSWSNWDADHIEMHSEGGETTLDNARVLCPSHNRGR